MPSSRICAPSSQSATRLRIPIYKVPQVEHVIPGGEKPFTEGMMSDKLKKGFYLVTIAHCMECHTPHGEGRAPVGHPPWRRWL